MTHTVIIEGSGHQFAVQEGETVLDAAIRAGLRIPYSCRGGSCGSCMGKIVEGEVSYPGDRLPDALDATAAAVGQSLFCQAQPLSDLVIEVRELRSGSGPEPRKLPCRVVALHRLSRDVMQLDLKIPERERLQFLAGQYIDILLRDGRRRSYSLANPPHRDGVLEIHVRHLPGGAFSEQVFSGMQEKALLRMEGPFGSFHLRDDSLRPVLMMAGGTGFAPLQGMLEHAFETGFTPPVHLYWGVRASEDLYRHALLLQWADEHPQFSYTPVLSEPSASDLAEGRFRTGWVHDAVIADYPQLGAYDVYMSGPPPMIHTARSAFVDRGLDSERLFFDAFEHAADAPVRIQALSPS
jgi:CDP-4-dehydro-6-deoxyglucose reductase, E3